MQRDAKHERERVRDSLASVTVLRPEPACRPLDAQARRDVAERSLRAMGAVLLMLRAEGNHEAADALTRARDEWRRVVARAVVHLDTCEEAAE